MRRFACVCSVLFLLAALLFSFGGCAQASFADATSLEDLAGKTVAHLEGSPYMAQPDPLLSDCRFLEYESAADMIQALKNGRVGGYIMDEPMAKFQLQEDGALRQLSGALNDKITYGFILSPSNDQLGEALNEALAKLKAQGVLQRLEQKWMTPGAERTPVEWEAPTSKMLTVYYAPDSLPFAYFMDGRPAGYDIELMQLAAKEMGYGVEFQSCDFDGVLAGVITGKCDIGVGCILYSEERAEELLFTSPTYVADAVAVVLDQNAEQTGFFAGVANSFYKTFVREDRYQMILKGLLTTVILALCALVLGTALGFGFCFLLRSKYKPVAIAAKWLQTILNALPLLIVLMVLYYVILVKTSLPAMVIGVLGLSISFANQVANVLNAGIGGVDVGQVQAAVSMGYSKWQVFSKIIFPQVLRREFPQYAGLVIGLVKDTSLLGYITVEDLTKASDIIRSMTYDAFFPLLVTAFIYFVLARIFVWLLSFLAKRIDPTYRKRFVKGVSTDGTADSSGTS